MGIDGDTGFLESFHRELCVPADRSEDWVLINCMREPYETFGPESEKAAAQMSLENEKYVPDQLVLLPGGSWPGGASLTGYWDGQAAYDNFHALPRDPDALLAKIYSLTAGAGPSRDGEALVWIADTVRQSTVPADFRAALYKAAIGVPDVTVVDEQATLYGSTGIAIGRYELNGNFRQDIVYAATGSFGRSSSRMHRSPGAARPRLRYRKEEGLGRLRVIRMHATVRNQAIGETSCSSPMRRRSSMVCSGNSSPPEATTAAAERSSISPG